MTHGVLPFVKRAFHDGHIHTYFKYNNIYCGAATSPQATLRRRRCLRYSAGRTATRHFVVTAHRCDSAEKLIVEYTSPCNTTSSQGIMADEIKIEILNF